jgi:signal transduction histidine kinase
MDVAVDRTEDQQPSSRRLLIFMMVGIGVLSGLNVMGQALRGSAGWWLALDVAVGVAGLCLIPLLVRRPVHGTVLLGLLAALSPVGTPAATLAALTVAQRRPFRIAVAAAVPGVLAHVVQGLFRPIGGISYGWWLAFIVVAYAALLGWGARNRAHWALLASLRERARQAEAERDRRVTEARALERTRIAREMHDVLAHRLTLVATYAGALEYRPDSPPEQLATAAGVVRSGVHQALEELRDVIGVMRTEPGAEAGGRPAPVLADVPRLVDEARRSGQRVALDARTTDPPRALAAAAAKQTTAWGAVARREALR